MKVRLQPRTRRSAEPPALRGQRIATPALAELSTRLLQRSRVVCLFVNDCNEPALALYRRLGFRQLAAWTSVFYVREGA